MATGTYVGTVTIPQNQTDFNWSAPPNNVAAQLAGGNASGVQTYDDWMQYAGMLQAIEMENAKMKSQIAAVAAATQNGPALSPDAQQVLIQMNLLASADAMADRGMAIQPAPPRASPATQRAVSVQAMNAAVADANAYYTALQQTQRAQIAFLPNYGTSYLSRQTEIETSPPSIVWPSNVANVLQNTSEAVEAVYGDNAIQDPYTAYALTLTPGADQNFFANRSSTMATSNGDVVMTNNTTATSEAADNKPSLNNDTNSDAKQDAQSDDKSAVAAGSSLSPMSTSSQLTQFTPGAAAALAASSCPTMAHAQNRALATLANAGNTMLGVAQTAINAPQNALQTNSSDVLAGVVPLSVAAPGVVDNYILPPDARNIQGYGGITPLADALPLNVNPIPGAEAYRGLQWYTAPFVPGPTAATLPVQEALQAGARTPQEVYNTAMALSNNAGYGAAQYAVNNYGVAMPIGTLATVTASNLNNGYYGGWQLATWQPAFLGAPPTYYTTGSVCGYRRLPAAAPFGPESAGAAMPCGNGACNMATPFADTGFPAGVMPPTPTPDVSMPAVNGGPALSVAQQHMMQQQMLQQQHAQQQQVALQTRALQLGPGTVFDGGAAQHQVTSAVANLACGGGPH